MTIRRSVLASLIAGIVFISAAPAWAVYTKFVKIEKSHAGGDLKVEGRLILDDKKNPDLLPIDAPLCPQDRTVKIQRKKDGEWKDVGQTTTDNDGRFSKKVADKTGDYRLVAPEAGKGDVTCDKARKGFNHNH